MNIDEVRGHWGQTILNVKYCDVSAYSAALHLLKCLLGSSTLFELTVQAQSPRNGQVAIS